MYMYAQHCEGSVSNQGYRNSDKAPARAGESNLISGALTGEPEHASNVECNLGPSGGTAHNQEAPERERERERGV